MPFVHPRGKGREATVMVPSHVVADTERSQEGGHRISQFIANRGSAKTIRYCSERTTHPCTFGNGGRVLCESKKPPSSRISEEIEKLNGRQVLLHVGSNIPRKQIDVLLRVLCLVKQRINDVLLLKVGDPWTPEQDALICELGIGESIVHFGKLERLDLAACYRRANAVVIPSNAEGFGLPVIEAMACGAAVVASDIPVLRETGGNAAMFAPVGDIEAWAHCVEQVLQGERSVPSKRIDWRGLRNSLGPNTPGLSPTLIGEFFSFALRNGRKNNRT